MKSRKNFLSLLLLTVLIATVLTLKGCGGDDENSQVCPSGSVIATGSDVITVPGDSTLEIAENSIPGPINIVPVKFIVTDQFASEKNNICMIFYATMGGQIVDRTYTSVLNDANGRWVTQTDAHGTVDVYYQTQAAPVSNPATSTAAGADIKFDNGLYAASGALTGDWKITVTIRGCDANTFGLGTCP